MNYLVTLGFLFAFTTSATTLVAQNNTNKALQIVFTQDMDEAALESIQDFVKSWGVILTINSTEYENNLLQTIDFSISTDKGNGSAKGEVRPDRNFGFRYDPKLGTNYAVVVGTLAPPSSTIVAEQDRPKDFVEVVFTKEMDEAALKSIQQIVKPLGVDLQINGTEYKNGLLYSIDFSVVTATASGSAKGEIRPDRKFGFQYNPKGGTKVAVVVGSLDQAR
ncbi:MAG: hypothetical protein ABIY71_03025 [Flavobacteriales bacterium]